MALDMHGLIAHPQRVGPYPQESAGRRESWELRPVFGGMDDRIDHHGRSLRPGQGNGPQRAEHPDRGQNDSSRETARGGGGQDQGQDADEYRRQNANRGGPVPMSNEWSRFEFDVGISTNRRAPPDGPNDEGAACDEAKNFPDGDRHLSTQPRSESHRFTAPSSGALTKDQRYALRAMSSLPS